MKYLHKLSTEETINVMNWSNDLPEHIVNSFTIDADISEIYVFDQNTGDPVLSDETIPVEYIGVYKYNDLYQNGSQPFLEWINSNGSKLYIVKDAIFGLQVDATSQTEQEVVSNLKRSAALTISPNDPNLTQSKIMTVANVEYKSIDRLYPQTITIDETSVTIDEQTISIPAGTYRILALVSMIAQYGLSDNSEFSLGTFVPNLHLGTQKMIFFSDSYGVTLVDINITSMSKPLPVITSNSVIYIPDVVPMELEITHDNSIVTAEYIGKAKVSGLNTSSRSSSDPEWCYIFESTSDLFCFSNRLVWNSSDNSNSLRGVIDKTTKRLVDYDNATINVADYTGHFTYVKDLNHTSDVDDYVETILPAIVIDRSNISEPK